MLAPSTDGWAQVGEQLGSLRGQPTDSLLLIGHLGFGCFEAGNHLADLAEEHGTLFRLASKRPIARRDRAHAEHVHAREVSIDFGDHLSRSEDVGHE